MASTARDFQERVFVRNFLITLKSLGGITDSIILWANWTTAIPLCAHRITKIMLVIFFILNFQEKSEKNAKKILEVAHQTVMCLCYLRTTDTIGRGTVLEVFCWD